MADQDIANAIFGYMPYAVGRKPNSMDEAAELAKQMAEAAAKVAAPFLGRPATTDMTGAATPKAPAPRRLTKQRKPKL